MMRETVLLFFFLFCFLFIVLLLYYFLRINGKVEKRINYYFEIDKSLKRLNRKKIRTEEGISSLKAINKILRGKLSGKNQEKIDLMLKSAGVTLNPEEYIMLKWFLAAIVGGIIYFLLDNIYLSIPGAILGNALPRIWLKRKIELRIQSFNEGLPDMIATVISSLRSGYSFTQALKTVVEECDSPIKDEIGLVMKELNYGIAMEDALNNLTSRMPSNDLELMLQAVLIQRQVGGNLAGVLEIILVTIRERNRIQRQVKTLTSQGRLSGRVIGALPVVLGFMIYLINPEYIKTLFTNRIGIIIITVGIISGIIGFILIHKLTEIEV